MIKLHSRIRPALLLLLTVLLLSRAGLCMPIQADFSGTWKQDNQRSEPRRTGSVVLRIEQHGPELVVETTAARSAGAPRHAVQRYTTDGKISVSIGADGDEFHTSVVWDSRRLVLSIEEHEDGRVILSKETWTLIEDGAALQREREVPAEGRKQMLIYERQPSATVAP